MPRPGQLTRGRANRVVKTPGGRLVVHRRKNYRATGKCALTGAKMQTPRGAKHGLSGRTSKSTKRPNRPYGGVVTPKALRRAIIRRSRE
jgi:large subunit ribosomal protein L34e